MKSPKINIYQGLSIKIYPSTKSNPNFRSSLVMKIYKLRVWHRSKTHNWRERNL